jgi:SAM-dependent methyltransferase
VTSAAVPAVEPWAFWAPTSDDLIEAALNLANVTPGDRLLDLGCGDGRVLVAAARRGASVRGVEVDPSLAGRANQSLAAANVSGQVECADMFEASLDADVIYAYLTPVTLMRLLPRLQSLPPGVRIVAPRYGLTGWQERRFADGCFLYETPLARMAAPERRGWEFRGLVMAVPADRRCLLPLTFAASVGDFGLELSPGLNRIVRWDVPAGPLSGPALVPIDLQVRPCATGSVVAGTLTCQGQELSLGVVFTGEGHGKWGFPGGQGTEFERWLRETAGRARRVTG